MSYCIGFDIGGTKCAVSLGEIADGNIRVLQRQETPTLDNPQATLSILAPFVKEWVKEYGVENAGISCGGPLDSKKGLIVSPPQPCDGVARFLYRGVRGKGIWFNGEAAK